MSSTVNSGEWEGWRGFQAEEAPVTSTEGAIMTYLVFESRDAQNSESILIQEPRYVI